MASDKRGQKTPKAATGVSSAHQKAPTKKRQAVVSPSPSNEKRQSRPTKQRKITSFLVSDGDTSAARVSSSLPNDASETGDFVTDVSAFISNKDPEPPRSLTPRPSGTGAEVGNRSHDSDLILSARRGLPFPAELVLEICNHLGAKDVLQLARTSKLLRETITRYHVLHQQAGREDGNAKTLNTTDRLMRSAFAKGGDWYFKAIEVYLRNGGPISDQGGQL